MKTSLEIPICPDVPEGGAPNSEWQSHYDALLQDDFLKKKYDRSHRLADKWNYIHTHFPELDCSSPEGLVVDIGPGPGEFLELCRCLGYGIQGVDAPTEIGGMGAPYLALSSLMTNKNKIPVEYCGLAEWIKCSDQHIASGSVALINSQGSIEQSCAHLMDGPSHELHHDCSQLSWRKGPELSGFFEEMMVSFAKCLMPGGIIFIYANGARNTRLYNRVVEKSARLVGNLQLMDKGKRIHKWVKEGN